MANGDPNPAPPNPDINDIPESSGGTPMGFLGISVMAVYLILIGFLSICGLAHYWPVPKADQDGGQGATSHASWVEPSGGSHFTLVAGPAPDPKQTFAWWPVREDDETRLLMVVLLAGALGSLVHGFRSLYWYVGNRKLVRSWSLMYLLMPLLGATTALVFYLVIRGGFFTTNASTKDTSPFGFAALAVLVGMFTTEATQKLKNIAETAFTQAEKGKDHVASAPTISKVEPDKGSVDGGDQVVITGTGFVAESIVRFGGQPAQKSAVSNGGTTLTVTTPKASAPGPVPLEVINPGGLKTSFSSFTYQTETGKNHVAAAPIISKIEPPTGSISGGYPVTITGSGFVPDSVVKFEGQLIQKPQVSKDGTTLTVTAPQVSAEGPATVEVVNPGDQKATGSFTYTSP